MPSEHGGTLAHADDAMSAATGERAAILVWRRLSDAVADLDDQGGLAVVQPHLNRRSWCVPHRVAQCLLHNPVSGEVNSVRKRPGSARYLAGGPDTAVAG